MPLAIEVDVAFNPVAIGLLGADAVVLRRMRSRTRSSSKTGGFAPMKWHRCAPLIRYELVIFGDFCSCSDRPFGRGGLQIGAEATSFEAALARHTLR